VLPYAHDVSATIVLLTLAAVVAVVDWWAVDRGRRPIEFVAKPMTMSLLVLVAAVAGDVPGDVRVALVMGALFGLGGDIALLGTGEAAFMGGLGSFAVGHVAYAVAALLLSFDLAWALPGVVFIVCLLGVRFTTQTVPGAQRRGGSVLAGAVVFYAAVISAMVIAAWATGEWLAAVGAMLFAVSDWILGYQRFVSSFGRHGRLAVIVPYHVGQALLIMGLAGS
jgi:uncharacterized membrane protein YhhN